MAVKTKIDYDPDSNLATVINLIGGITQAIVSWPQLTTCNMGLKSIVYSHATLGYEEKCYKYKNIVLCTVVWEMSPTGRSKTSFQVYDWRLSCTFHLYVCKNMSLLFYQLDVEVDTGCFFKYIEKCSAVF